MVAAAFDGSAGARAAVEFAERIAIGGWTIGALAPTAVFANLKIVTSNFREGYLRKNGVPYSEQAVVTEYIHRLPTHPNGDSWLHVVTIVEDPRYLSQPYYTSTNFRLEANDGASLAGTVVSGVVGFLSIHYLLRFVRTHSLTVFCWYIFLFAPLSATPLGEAEANWWAGHQAAART